jgi:hypothetical protein
MLQCIDLRRLLAGTSLRGTHDYLLREWAKCLEEEAAMTAQARRQLLALHRVYTATCGGEGTSSLAVLMVWCGPMAGPGTALSYEEVTSLLVECCKQGFARECWACGEGDVINVVNAIVEVRFISGYIPSCIHGNKVCCIA